MDQRIIWVLIVIGSLVGGFFAGKYYAEHNRTSDGFKLEWKFDKSKDAFQP